MLHKTFDAIDIKADGETGEFTATVAAFGNVDLVGDRILPGAFSKSLEKWRTSGDPIPIILSHQHENPMSHIGVAYPQDVQETSKGLFVKGTLDIGDNEVARQVHKLMKRRSLKEFSFGYKVPKGGEQRAKDGANELSEIDLFEAGPTLKGANPDTELHGVKSALSKQTDNEDEQESSDDQPPTSQQARILNSMIGQGQEYIDSNPDAEDAAEMADILDTLKELQDEPASDSDSKAAASAKASPSAATLRKRSDAAVLEIQSGGLSLRKQPATAIQEPSDPADVLATIHGLMQGFVDAEDDPADIAAMQDLMDGLSDLMDTEASEDDTPKAGAPEAKAVWSTAFINNLPDSAFLYIAPGGSKDSDGKTTPRSLRHFPYKDASGNVDLPHLRNALARIPQSDLPQSVKDTATAKAQRILSDNSKSAVEDARDKDRHAGKSRKAQDLLRKRSDATLLEIQSGGLSLRKPPKVKEPVKAEPLNEAELKRRSRNAMLAILTGADTK